MFIEINTKETLYKITNKLYWGPNLGLRNSVLYFLVTNTYVQQI